MQNKRAEINSLLESRFGSVIFLLRLAGIPFHMKKISPVYAIYMITVVFCTCITYIGMCVDVYVHKDDLQHAMTTIRMLIHFSNAMWIYFYCRYVITVVITFEATQKFV